MRRFTIGPAASFRATEALDPDRNPIHEQDGPARESERQTTTGRAQVYRGREATPRYLDLEGEEEVVIRDHLRERFFREPDRWVDDWRRASRYALHGADCDRPGSLPGDISYDVVKVRDLERR